MGGLGIILQQRRVVVFNSLSEHSESVVTRCAGESGSGIGRVKLKDAGEIGDGGVVVVRVGQCNAPREQGLNVIRDHPQQKRKIVGRSFILFVLGER